MAVADKIFFAPSWSFNGPTLIIALAGFIFMIPLFFFISKKVSPGAGDNMNGSSIAVHVGRYFAQRRKSGKPLKNTRLILISTDGEEAGQRDYVSRHGDELKAVPACVLNIDSVYNYKDLAVLLRDRHGFLPLCAQLAKDCVEIASDLGHVLKTIAAPFGSGTDAAAFAKAGIKATAFIGLPTSLFDNDHIYHTLKDTVECIEPEAVEAVFNIANNYIALNDNE